jgi:hypothetical protein
MFKVLIVIKSGVEGWNDRWRVYVPPLKLHHYHLLIKDDAISRVGGSGYSEPITQAFYHVLVLKSLN